MEREERANGVLKGETQRESKEKNEEIIQLTKAMFLAGSPELQEQPNYVDCKQTEQLISAGRQLQ